jgi:hypothetical protein
VAPGLIWLALALVCAVLSFVLSRAKGLNPLVWVVVALLFGPMGLVACAGMPDRQLRARLRLRARELEALNESLAVIQRSLPRAVEDTGQESSPVSASATDVELISRDIFLTACPASEPAVWSGVQRALGDQFAAADLDESDVSFYEAHVRKADGSPIAWFRVQRRSGDRLEWHRER